MRAHNHGMVTQPSIEFDGLEFIVNGLQFHMSGEWTVSVDLSYENLVERKTLAVMVR
jgi:hypothetical protein